MIRAGTLDDGVNGPAPTSDRMTVEADVVSVSRLCPPERPDSMSVEADAVSVSRLRPPEPRYLGSSMRVSRILTSVR